jgi:hypothetical protein
MQEVYCNFLTENWYYFFENKDVLILKKDKDFLRNVV